MTNSTIPEEPPIKARLTLVGLDGNAFSVIGTVRNGLRKACREAGFDSVKTAAIIAQFSDEAMSGDYDNVLRAAIRWTEDE